jgi:uncharacterized membrane protein YhaH (DUF805 family)
MGLYSYFGISSESVTALIPAFFGVPMLILGWLGLNEKYLKHAMLCAAILTLLGFAGTVSGLVKFFNMLGGAELERPVAVTVQAIMAVLCLVFLVLAVKSIIDLINSMFLYPFSFEGRIRRTEYWLSLIISAAFPFIIDFFIVFTGINEGIMYVLLIPEYWFIFAQGAKRCHDIGNSGWYQIIPFYGLWMLFVDSKNGINKYGPNPKGIEN